MTDSHATHGDPPSASNGHAPAGAAAHGDGHGDGHHEAALGPVDWPAWLAGIAGVAIAVVIVACLVAVAGPLGG